MMISTSRRRKTKCKYTLHLAIVILTFMVIYLLSREMLSFLSFIYLLEWFLNIRDKALI